MREQPDLTDMKAAWLNQPEEEAPVNLDQVYRRRTSELFSITRSETISSIGAALFFACVMTWRFAPERNRLVLIGCAVAVLWAVATGFRFRASLRRGTPSADAFAATGVEHYRQELTRRRNHLRSAWIWHGPLWLTGLIAVAILAGRAVPGRLWNALPVLAVLAVWAAFGIRRRLRQAAVLQHEIDELTGDSPVERERK